MERLIHTLSCIGCNRIVSQTSLRVMSAAAKSVIDEASPTFYYGDYYEQCAVSLGREVSSS